VKSRKVNRGCLRARQSCSLIPGVHRSEAPKKISETAPATTVDTVAKPGIFQSGAAAEDAPAVLVAAAAALRLWDDVVSPSELDALPRMELSKAHIWRMLFTSEGKSGVSNTAVWFVCSKLENKRMRWGGIYIVGSRTHQSAHCGKADWNVSVQAHLITLMNAPGLKMTFEWCDMAKSNVQEWGTPEK